MDPRARSDAELGMDDTNDGVGPETTGIDLDHGHDRAPGHPSMRLVPIEHDEYDALADLFLGDGALAPEPIGAERSSLPSHETHTPVLHLTRDEEEAELSGSVGSGVLESLEATGLQASTLMSELMGEERDGIEHDGLEMVRMPVPSIEVVVLGHLPVRATLWARQYACSTAKERGEVVGLVRAAAGSTAIDLITGREPVNAGGNSEIGMAVGTLHERADRVILRVDERHEPELLDRPEVETITVLTRRRWSRRTGSSRRLTRRCASGMRTRRMGRGSGSR